MEGGGEESLSSLQRQLQEQTEEVRDGGREGEGESGEGRRRGGGGGEEEEGRRRRRGGSPHPYDTILAAPDGAGRTKDGERISQEESRTAVTAGQTGRGPERGGGETPGGHEGIGTETV